MKWKRKNAVLAEELKSAYEEMEEQREAFRQAYWRQLVMASATNHLAAGFTEPPPEPKPLPKELVADPIEGWRAWGVVDALPLSDHVALGRMADAWDAGRNPFRELIGPWLSPVGTDTARPWLGGEAVCRVGGNHPAPHPYCHCGFWAMKTREDAETACATYQVSGVYGRVHMWGRIVEHGKGYRAQFAKPIELFVIGGQKLADGLAAQYGCPASVVDAPAINTEAALYTYGSARQFCWSGSYTTP